MKKNYLYIIIAGLLVLNIFTISKLNSIESSMNRNVQQIYNEQSNLRNEISSIYSSVDEKLKKQASILDSYDAAFGDELNEDDLTVPVNISVTPKENSESITASLLINNTRYKMLKNGTTFTASINAYVFDPFEIKVVLENNSIEKVETIEEYTDLQYKYMLDVSAHFSGSVKYGSGKYQYNGDLLINTFGNKNNRPEKISFLRYINGKLIEENLLYLFSDTSQFDDLTLPLNGDIELSADEKIEMYIIVQDKYGLNYKYSVMADEIDSNGKRVSSRPEWTNGSMVEIKDKNGKILLENKYKY